jgi:2-iminobutanoate/2-iminopropanoate deaminase
MSRQPIEPNAAPDPQGGYTPAIVANGFVFVSGQGALDPQTGEITTDEVAGQTARTLDIVEAVLAAAGAGLADVVKSTVHIADIETFGEFDRVYRERMPSPRPARTTVASVLAPGILVEIDVIAVLPEKD